MKVVFPQLRRALWLGALLVPASLPADGWADATSSSGGSVNLAGPGAPAGKGGNGAPNAAPNAGSQLTALTQGGSGARGGSQGPSGGGQLQYQFQQPYPGETAGGG